MCSRPASFRYIPFYLVVRSVFIARDIFPFYLVIRSVFTAIDICTPVVVPENIFLPLVPSVDYLVITVRPVVEKYAAFILIEAPQVTIPVHVMVAINCSVIIPRIM